MRPARWGAGEGGGRNGCPDYAGVPPLSRRIDARPLTPNAPIGRGSIAAHAGSPESRSRIDPGVQCIKVALVLSGHLERRAVFRSERIDQALMREQTQFKLLLLLLLYSRYRS